MESYHEVAQICMNGHIITDRLKESSDLGVKYCDKCGAETISRCRECGTPIRGDYIVPGVVVLSSASSKSVPNYCHECGGPYPWTSRIIENAVELLALDEELSQEQKEIIEGTFPDLMTENPTTPVAIAKYKKYVGDAQEFVKDGLKKILVKVATESAKESIWG